MRITCRVNLLLLGLVLVSGCIFHHKPVRPTTIEPIRMHEVTLTPEMTNTVSALAVTNAPDLGVIPNVPPITNPEPVTAIIVPEPTNPEPVTATIVAEPTNPVVGIVPVTPPEPVAPPPVIAKNAKLIVTPDKTTTATVTLVNQAAQFVVLTFPIGHLPQENQLMTLYRQGLKVGEVKVTDQQKDDNVVADIVSGDAQLGDEVR